MLQEIMQPTEFLGNIFGKTKTKEQLLSGARQQYCLSVYLYFNIFPKFWGHMDLQLTNPKSMKITKDDTVLGNNVTDTHFGKYLAVKKQSLYNPDHTGQLPSIYGGVEEDNEDTNFIPVKKQPNFYERIFSENILNDRFGLMQNQSKLYIGTNLTPSTLSPTNHFNG